jgi:hypothetical protein
MVQGKWRDKTKEEGVKKDGLEAALSKRGHDMKRIHGVKGLKRCPFCGAKAIVTWFSETPPDCPRPWFSVQCSKNTARAYREGMGCPVTATAIGESIELVKASWNTRSEGVA